MLIILCFYDLPQQPYNPQQGVVVGLWHWQWIGQLIPSFLRTLVLSFLICLAREKIPTGIYCLCKLVQAPNQRVDGTFHWITQLMLMALIWWIEIYQVDSIIHPLNNQAPLVQSLIKLILDYWKTFYYYLFTVKGGFFTRLRFKGKNFAIYNLVGPHFWGRPCFSGK